MDRFDLEVSQAVGQRNEEWHEERIGKFTASRFGDLNTRGRSYDSALNRVVELTGRLEALNKGEIDKEIEVIQKTLKNPPSGTRKATLKKRIEKLSSFSISATREELLEAQEVLERESFGDVANKYIYEKVAEIATNQFHEVTGKAVDWGTDNEFAALEAYQKETGNQVVQVGFISFDDYSGGSPDGLVCSNGIVEFKCPWNSANHVKMLVENNISNNYMWQDQFNMMVTGKDWCDHVSYDPRFPEGMRLVIIRIERSEDLIKQIKSRLKEATEKLKKLLNDYNKL